MREINWNEAPEWADRAGYTESNDLLVWLNQKQYTYADGSQKGRIFKFSSEGVFPLEDFHNIQYRPTQWRGMQDGLPPVGYTHKDCICIFVENGEFEILAHRDNEAVIYFKDKGSDEWSVDLALPGQFCPIQSERDKVRYKAIQAIDLDEARKVSFEQGVETILSGLFDAGMLVDPESVNNKPMSRAEAQKKIQVALQCNPPRGMLETAIKILNTLGYKE